MRKVQLLASGGDAARVLWCACSIIRYGHPLNLNVTFWHTNTPASGTLSFLLPTLFLEVAYKLLLIRKTKDAVDDFSDHFGHGFYFVVFTRHSTHKATGSDTSHRPETRSLGQHIR